MKPVYFTKSFQYELSPPDSEYMRTLTLRWGQRKVSVSVPLTSFLDKNSFSYMEERQYIAQKYGEDYLKTLRPLQLDQNLIVYIDPQKVISHSKNQDTEEVLKLQKTAITILKKIDSELFKNKLLKEFENEINTWLNEKGLSRQEEEGRKEAVQRIKRCIEEDQDTLSLQGLSLSSVPIFIGKLVQLRELDLSFNKIKEIPKEIKGLKNLQNLNISHTEILKSALLQEIQSEMDRWLNEKGLSREEEEDRKEAVRRIKRCIEEDQDTLSLQRLSLSSVPIFIGKLVQLRELDLSLNKIKEIPKEIGNLTNLERLNLSYNKLEKVPPEISKLIKLKELYLQCNNIQNIFCEIKTLVNLKQLNLYLNRIKEIPKEIGHLINLEELDLSVNIIKDIPNEISKLLKLKEINLACNRFMVISPIIFNLKNLEVLNLSLNLISVISPEIKNLRNLKKMFISLNKIVVIPAEIGALRSLQYLVLSNNPIRSLPQSLLELRAEVELNGHNLSEQTIQGLRELIDSRVARNMSVPLIHFDMPPPRNSLEPKSIEESFKILLKAACLDKLSFKIKIFSGERNPARLFLHNLLETSDFTMGSNKVKEKLAKTVLKCFEFASENPDFLESFNLFLDTANISCVDRTTFAVIDLEIWINLKQMMKKQGRENPFKILESLLACELLHEAGQAKFQELRIADELDIHLAFFIYCKAPLKKEGIELPFTPESMRFFEITKVSLEKDIPDATRHVLEVMRHPEKKAKKLVDFLFKENDVLAVDALQLLKSYFQKEVNEIDEKKHQKLEELDGFTDLTSQQYQDKINAIKADEKNGYIELLISKKF